MPSLAPFEEQTLDFSDDQIVVRATGAQVMMAWERPLMRRMAEIVAQQRGDVLEIGFGMGISCDEVQRLRPRSHTIVECHPQILERARAWAKGRAGVKIVGGRFLDVVEELGAFDGVSFDVFGGEDQRWHFFSHLRRLLRPRGRATLWLGDEPDLPAPMRSWLADEGWVWRLSRVSAIVDPRCRYSATNEFVIPSIARGPRMDSGRPPGLSTGVW